MTGTADLLQGWVTRAAYGTVGRERALSILALHRVHGAPDDLFPHEMNEQRFESLVRHLAAHHAVLPLGEAHEALRAGTLPARAVAITFDDGYADNASLAIPILRRHGVRATFFVSTGFLDGGLMWNDQVIECIRRCSEPRLDLGRLGLGVVPTGSAQERRVAIDRVLPKVKYLTLEAREDMLAWLRAACRPGVLPTDLMMTSEQVRAVAAAGMEVGGHTVRHPILACCDVPQARDEIAQGRATLRTLSGQPIDVFAYPNGVPGKDYRAEHVALLRELGFRCAVTTAAGIARVSDDPLQLPRYTPWDRTNWRWSWRLLRARRIATQRVATDEVAQAA